MSDIPISEVIKRMESKQGWRKEIYRILEDNSVQIWKPKRANSKIPKIEYEIKDLNYFDYNKKININLKYRIFVKNGSSSHRDFEKSGSWIEIGKVVENKGVIMSINSIETKLKKTLEKELRDSFPKKKLYDLLKRFDKDLAKFFEKEIKKVPMLNVIDISGLEKELRDVQDILARNTKEYRTQKSKRKGIEKALDNIEKRREGDIKSLVKRLKDDTRQEVCDSANSIEGLGGNINDLKGNINSAKETEKYWKNLKETEEKRAKRIRKEIKKLQKQSKKIEKRRQEYGKPSEKELKKLHPPRSPEIEVKTPTLNAITVAKGKAKVKDINEVGLASLQEIDGILKKIGEDYILYRKKGTKKSLSSYKEKGKTIVINLKNRKDVVLFPDEEWIIGRKTANSRLMTLSLVIRKAKKGELRLKTNKRKALRSVNQLRKSIGLKPLDIETYLKIK